MRWYVLLLGLLVIELCQFDVAYSGTYIFT